jgi:hypothetical protein
LIILAPTNKQENYSKMGNLNVKEWEISKLINAEYNPRVLKEHQFKQLKDSIERFGIVDPILVNVNKDRKGIIIGGHQRAYVCEKLGMKKIPAVELDLTLEQEKELNIRLNKNTGEWDFESLANYFDQNELIDWGFQDYEFGTVEGHDSDDEGYSPPDGVFDDDGVGYSEQYGVIIKCVSEREQEEIFKRLTGEGFECKIVVT